MNNAYVLKDPTGKTILGLAYFMDASSGDEKKALMTSLFVSIPHRGKGYAAKVLELVFADADKLGFTIILGVQPDDSSFKNRLRDFLLRSGFVRLPESQDPYCLARYPKS